MNINSIESSSTMLNSGVNAAKASDDTGRNEFLQLLATQLQYQDPLNPLQNSEFVAQLAQFSSLEQLILIRESLDNQQGGGGETDALASPQRKA
jgi:flagellar basal-body rod modification protein FlgD